MLSGYICMTRDTGVKAWIKCEEIAYFAENTTKVKDETTPCISIYLRNNVVMHFLITAEELLDCIKGATGQQVNVHELKPAA